MQLKGLLADAKWKPMKLISYNWFVLLCKLRRTTNAISCSFMSQIPSQGQEQRSFVGVAPHSDILYQRVTLQPMML